MAVIEDYTAASDFGTENYITAASATHLDVDALPENVAEGKYFDKGVDAINEIDDYLDVNVVNTASSSGTCVWAASKTLQDWQVWWNTTSGDDAKALTLRVVYSSTTKFILQLSETDDRTYDNSIGLLEATDWFLHFQRAENASTITCKIYTSAANRAAGTPIHDTLTVTDSVFLNETYRYKWAANSQDQSSSAAQTLDLENLTDNLATAPAAGAPSRILGGGIF